MARRIRVYAFGLILGCIISYIFLFKGNHNVTFWLPDERVLTQISDSITYSLEAECYLDCYSIDKKSVLKIIKDGDVDFGKSSTKETPKIYYIEGESISGKPMYFKARMLPQRAEIIEVQPVDALLNCDC
ncbi:MAG: DUF4258 domain-containing protein [Flavobacteriales bacterium]|nr:DUF4258 domain-containing protein [Flavobacteriales bacterium]